MSDKIEREESNHTYTVRITVSNLQEHQLDALSDFIGSLEINGVDCSTFDIEND